jgi:hypothetical protein
MLLLSLSFPHNRVRWSALWRSLDFEPGFHALLFIAEAVFRQMAAGQSTPPFAPGIQRDSKREDEQEAERQETRREC